MLGCSEEWESEQGPPNRGLGWERRRRRPSGRRWGWGTLSPLWMSEPQLLGPKTTIIQVELQLIFSKELMLAFFYLVVVIALSQRDYPLPS